MPATLPISRFLQLRESLLLDVRSPSEFQKAHIPGALNFPLFSDDERAQVGTAYKQQGSETALILGLDLVGPKMGNFLREARKLNPEMRPLRIHCFRGGQRSQSLAWLLEKGGFEVNVLEGGYKAYRRHVLESFAEPQKFMVLSGCTGSGKTRILGALAQRGMQVIDLEGLACHRGSAFGGYHQPPELTTEMFQNELHAVWAPLDRNVRVWVEDEGQRLGGLMIPDPFWNQMRQAPVLFLDVPQGARAGLLLEEYGQYEYDRLKDSIDKISKRLGGVTHQQCLQALAENDRRKVATLCLNYYDKAYLYCLEKRQPESLRNLVLDDVDTERNVQSLLDFLEPLVQSGEL